MEWLIFSEQPDRLVDQMSLKPERFSQTLKETNILSVILDDFVSQLLPAVELQIIPVQIKDHQFLPVQRISVHPSGSILQRPARARPQTKGQLDGWKTEGESGKHVVVPGIAKDERHFFPVDQ